MKTWGGSKPTTCDLCKCQLVKTFVDGRTKFGPWGILCLTCHKQHGVGLGIGKGQQYELHADKWVLSDREIKELLAEKDGAVYDHQPRECQGVEPVEDIEFVDGI